MNNKLYSQDEVYELCRSVGFNAKNARIASAIALCEAPFTGADIPMANFGAVGDQDLADETWGFSYGGFQIRSLRSQKGTGGFRDEKLLVRPRFNCRAARAIFLSSGWAAWSTFTSHMYRAYLQDAWTDSEGHVHPPMFPPAPGTYVVLAGDTLSEIAAEYDTTVETLAALNHIEGPRYLISIGQILHLPV